MSEVRRVAALVLCFFLASSVFLMLPAKANTASVEMAIEDVDTMRLSVDVLPDISMYSSRRYTATTVAGAKNSSLGAEILHLLHNFTGDDEKALVSANIVTGSGISVESAGLYFIEYASSSTSRPVFFKKGLRVTAVIRGDAGRWSIDSLLPVYGVDGTHGANDSAYTPTVKLVVKGTSRLHLTVNDDDTVRFPWGEEVSYSWGWDEFDGPEVAIEADDSIILSPLFTTVVEAAGVVLLVAFAVALSIARRLGIPGSLLVGFSLVMIPLSLMFMIWPEWVHPLFYVAPLLLGVILQVSILALPQAKAPAQEEKPDADPLAGTETHYTLLGVPEDASFDAIRQAYKGRLHEYHPDKVANAGPKIVQMAQEETIKITDAYKVLKETGSRKKYDEELERRRKLGI